MRCADFEQSLNDTASDQQLAAESLSHARECVACAVALRNHRSLRRGLAALSQGETREPPASIEAQLLRELRPRPRIVGMPVAVRVLAGSLAASVALLFLMRPQDKPVGTEVQTQARKQTARRQVASTAPPTPAQPQVARASARKKISRATRNVSHARIRSGSEFTAIPYAEPLQPGERAELVRVNMPLMTLASWGFPLPGIDPERSIEADVLVGENGLARAVRLVR